MDITFENVSYIYQQHSPFAHKAVDQLSFHVPSGTFLAIVGHTGSGKSTLIQHLNGLVQPTAGKVKIGDFQLTADKKPKDMKQLRSNVGVVFQYPEHQLFEETVAKDISFGPKNFGVGDSEIQRRVTEALQAVGLTEDYLERSPFDLSGGQMRRVAIAGVLATKPNVLVLDEPTAGLDPRGQKEMMNMFYERHRAEQLTTVLVTHSMEDAVTYADHVLILNKGRKYMEGKPEEVFIQKEALQKVQLDVPEVVAFLDRWNEKFNTDLPFTRQSELELAAAIAAVIKGGKNHE